MQDLPDKVKGFIVLRSHVPGIRLLSREQKGDLLDALVADMMGEAHPVLDPVTNVVFSMMLPAIHDAQEEYRRKAQISRENGKNGGRPKKQRDDEKPDGLDSEEEKPTGFEKTNGFSKNQNREEKSGKEQNFNEMSNEILPETPVSDESGSPLCPQNAMLALYHEVLPELPRIRTLRKPLQEQVRTRWREKYDEGKFSTTAEGLEYFRGFFAYVKNCSFLMGKNKTGWTCDYRWIMKADHFDKITEGKYEDRA